MRDQEAILMDATDDRRARRPEALRDDIARLHRMRDLERAALEVAGQIHDACALRTAARLLADELRDE